MRRSLALWLALVGAAACAGPTVTRRPLPEPTCPAVIPAVFAETSDRCGVPDAGGTIEPPSCIPERSRGGLLVRDDELGIRIFHACRTQPTRDRSSTVGVDPRRVMAERMGRRPPTPDELATALHRLPRRGSDEGATSLVKCPLVEGPGSEDDRIHCLTVQLPDRDLPTVTRLLSRALRDLDDACVPVAVDLGVPVPCLPSPNVPLEGR